MNLETVIKLSNTYGNNPELVLAGGGNTSIKSGSSLFVKASGTALSSITEHGFVEMDRNKLNQIFNKKYPDDDREREKEVLDDLMSSRINQYSEARPSVETLLHSLFDYALVLHLHPALINGLTCSRNAELASKKLFVSCPRI